MFPPLLARILGCIVESIFVCRIDGCRGRISSPALRRALKPGIKFRLGMLEERYGIGASPAKRAPERFRAEVPFRRTSRVGAGKHGKPGDR
jgi:hypothetical protein